MATANNNDNTVGVLLSNGAGGFTGTTPVRVVVDPYNRVAETNESNNTAFSSADIEAVRVGLPECDVSTLNEPGNPGTAVNNPAFGKITGVDNPRIGQLALKLTF